MTKKYELYGIEPCPYCEANIFALVEETNRPERPLPFSSVRFTVKCAGCERKLFDGARNDIGRKDDNDEWFVRAVKSLMKEWKIEANNKKEEKCQRLKTSLEEGTADSLWSNAGRITLSRQIPTFTVPFGNASVTAETPSWFWREVSEPVTLSRADVSVVNWHDREH